MSKNKKGFTLVELSIALVIIGLLIGGILIAQSLISSSKAKMVVQEYEQYIAAIRLFHDRFGGLPGDSSKAGTLLGVSGGDDSGAIEWNDESYYSWNHLALSGFLEDSYTGTHTGGAAEIGVNVPESIFFKGRAMWFLQGSSTYDQSDGSLGWNMWYLGTDLNKGRTQLRLAERKAGKSSGPGNHPWAGPLTVDEVASIDKKFDDGIPGTGDIGHHAPWSSMFDCTTGDTVNDTYNFSQDGDGCHVSFWLPDF